MVLESSKHTTFSLLYEKEAGSVTLTNLDTPAIDSPAIYAFHDSIDHIIFDNDQPGRIHTIRHSITNHAALDVLSRAIFDDNYCLIIESIHDGAHIYGYDIRRGQIEVPFTHRRRLARIALHNLAADVSQNVIDLHTRLQTQAA